MITNSTPKSLLPVPSPRLSRASDTLSISLSWNRVTQTLWPGPSELAVPCAWPSPHLAVFLYYHPRDALPISPLSEFPISSVSLYFSLQLCFVRAHPPIAFKKKSTRGKNFAFWKITLVRYWELALFFKMWKFSLLSFGFQWCEEVNVILLHNSEYITCFFFLVKAWESLWALLVARSLKVDLQTVLKFYFYPLCWALNGTFSLQTHALYFWEFFPNYFLDDFLPSVSLVLSFWELL